MATTKGVKPTAGRPTIYGLYDSCGELRYIGKANCLPDRMKGHMRDSTRKNTPLYAWIRKNGQPEMRAIEADCENWQEAERRLIAESRLRGDRLLNLADGGDQPLVSKEVCAENGRKNAASRNPVIHSLLRELGQSAAFLKKVGMLAMLPKIADSQALLRRLTKDGKAVFAAEWVRRERGHKHVA